MSTEQLEQAELESREQLKSEYDGQNDQWEIPQEFPDIWDD